MERRRRRRYRKPRWPKIVIGVTIVALVVLLGVSVALMQDQPVVEVTLNGDQEVVLEFGSEYTDPGAAGCWYDKILNKEPTALDVTVESGLDPDKVGTYSITYRAEYEGVIGTAVRTVRVVDTEAPQIMLVVDPNHYTIEGEEYQEEGFTAVDNYDGDITDRVERKVLEARIIYTVADSSGNTTEVAREIEYLSPEAPTLTLLGDAKITVDAGTKWTDPGCKATDYFGKDITDTVIREGNVDIYNAGTYEVNYSVTDDYGNTVTAKRTVTVKAIKQPETSTTTPNTNSGEKVIYLTFDDGPSVHTPQLLAILEKYNVKATFFVCKTRYPEYMKDIVEGGHSIGIHSLTHKYEEIYASEEAFFNDLNAMSDMIYEYSGVRTTLMRFPGGGSNSISKKICEGIMTKLTKAVQDQGYQYFDWNVDSNDAGGAQTADEVAQNVINGVQKRNYSFVLQHDTKSFSVEAVEQIIVWGLNNGYTFLALEPDSPVCHHGVNN